MSIDRRLRDAFLAASQETQDDLDVERHLRHAVARAQPHEVGRAVATIVLVAALVGGVFAAGALVEGARHVPQPLDGGETPTVGADVPAQIPRTALDGVYTTTVRISDGRAAGLPHVDAFAISGPMEVWFSRDTVRVEQSLRGVGQIPVLGTIEVAGSRLSVHEDGETLTLEWRRLANGDLRFTVVDDTRTGVERLVGEVLWTSHPWTPMSG
jgi:hypothetical protein